MFEYYTTEIQTMLKLKLNVIKNSDSMDFTQFGFQTFWLLEQTLTV